MSEPTYGKLETVRGDAEAIIEVAKEAARPPVVLDPNTPYGVFVPHGHDFRTVVVEDPGAAPLRRTGVVRVDAVVGLVGYVQRIGVSNPTLWSEPERGQITAVLNDHTAEDADWGDHRVVLTLRKSPAWKAWTQASGVLSDQEAFAEFLEDHIPEIAVPDAADLLEVVTTFQAKKGVTFKQGTKLTSGEVQFRYEETIEASAGAKGDLTVPSSITLALPVFEGTDRVMVTARLRYRIQQGGLRIGFVLDRPDEVLRDAFANVEREAAESLAVDVWRGTPRPE